MFTGQRIACLSASDSQCVYYAKYAPIGDLKMRFGISNLLFPSLTEETRVQILKYSEICDFAPTAVYGTWNNVPAVLPEHPYAIEGPVISALQSLFFGVTDASLVKDGPAFEVLMRHFEQLAALAGISGIPFLIFGSPGTRSSRLSAVPDAKVLDRVAILADISATNRVKLCFEVNSPKFGCEYLAQNAALHALMLELHHPGLGLHLDVGQMLEEGLEVVQYLSDSSDDLVHLHLSAPDFTCRIDLLPLYRDIIRQLKTNGCRADVVLEVQRLDTTSELDLVAMCKELSIEVAG